MHWRAQRVALGFLPGGAKPNRLCAGLALAGDIVGKGVRRLDHADAKLISERDQRVMIRHMHPVRAKIDGRSEHLHRMCPSADAVSRLQHAEGKPGLPRPPCSGDAGGAGADDDEVEGSGHSLPGPFIC